MSSDDGWPPPRRGTSARRAAAPRTPRRPSLAAQQSAALGAEAEALAARFLEARGLAIVTRNFRTRRGEIDLIARDGDTLVFVEVRLRSDARHGSAAESITAAKRARLVAAAQYYLLRVPGPPPCRFDAILLDGPAPDRVDWRRNVIDAG